MDQIWTIERINSLAPDASAQKAGLALASARKWVLLGRSERALWGECQGSGASPYQAEVDLTGPAFKCSCPSRKFPCKHSLGLLYLFSGEPSAFNPGPAPQWVVDWLARREQQAGRKKPAAGASTGSSADASIGSSTVATSEATSGEQDDQAVSTRRTAARAKRASDRNSKVRAGLADLEVWLRDLMRQGLGTLQTRPQLFTGMAARMVDAQAPGIARQLSEMAGIPATGQGWADRLVAELGKLHLLLEGFKRIESLPEPVQFDIRSAIGWTVREEDVAGGEVLGDEWQVLGQRVYDEERLRVRRTWLRGRETARDALILDFAFKGQSLSPGLMAGTSLKAGLVFYPSARPIRAFLKEQLSAPKPLETISAHASLEHFLQYAAQAVSENPWIGVVPAPLDSVVPVIRKDRWYLRDRQGALLRFRPRFDRRWQVMALSGGRPVFVFAEWDGGSLFPLGVFAEGRFVHLGSSLG